MPRDEAGAPRRPRRRRLLGCAAFAALLLALGAFAAHRYTRPEKLTALLVGEVRSLFGAELSLDGAAGFGFVPQLRLDLPRPALAAAGTPVLRAESVEVAMPWRTLWSDRIDVERVVLDRPELDLDALSAWLAARPSGGAAPDVRFALRVRGGTIVSAGRHVAEGVDLDLANAGDLAAWLADLRAGGRALPPLGGHADAAAVEIGGVRIEGLRVDAGDEAGAAPRPQERR